MGKEIKGIKSINWNANEITSFADCDTLVVDATSLSEKLLQSINSEQAKELFDEIKKRFKTGLEIICVTGKSFTTSVNDHHKKDNPHHVTSKRDTIDNYFWSPISCNYDKNPKGKTLQEINQNFKFVKYLEVVNEFNISMNKLMVIKNNYWSKLNTIEVLSPSDISKNVESKQLILSNSGDLLGGEFSGSAIQ